MADNAILQRTIYKFESGIQELDAARNGHDLNLVCERQLRTIVALEKQLDLQKVDPSV